MKVWLKRFVLMLQFLTTIPVPLSLEVDQEDFGKGLVFAPVIGFFIGLVLAGFSFLVQNLLPMSVIAALIVAIYILLTGGLHLDGLGDTFDGLFSNRPVERILEIMRDSRVGTNAVLAVFCVLLINVVSLVSIKSDVFLYTAVILMPVAGRMGSVIGAGISKYARSGAGLGKAFIEVCSIKHSLAGLVMAYFCFVGTWRFFGGDVFGGDVSLLFTLTMLFLLIVLSSVVLTGLFSKKINGMTGDTLGAVCELNQSIFLLGFLILYRTQ